MTSAPEAHKTAGVPPEVIEAAAKAMFEHLGGTRFADDLQGVYATIYPEGFRTLAMIALGAAGVTGIATRLGRPLTVEEDADLLEAEWSGSEASVSRVTNRILASRSTPSVPAVAELSGALSKFAKWAITEGPFAGGDLSGGEVQDKAVELGLLREVSYDPAEHGEFNYGLEPGDSWFVFAGPLRDGLPRRVAGAAELSSLQAENRKLKADLRSYEVTFNIMHETAAERDVLAERRRQIAEEGWTPEHDDGHDLGQLSLAAALYAIPYETVIGGEDLVDRDTIRGLHMKLEIVGDWFLKAEPDTRRRKVKAAALLLAEIERLDRKEAGNGVS